MNFYIYDNWQAIDRSGPKIHTWNCGHCHMGFGKHRNAKRGEHGVWIGPFEKIEFARNYFQSKFDHPLNECGCIKE